MRPSRFRAFKEIEEPLVVVNDHDHCEYTLRYWKGGGYNFWYYAVKHLQDCHVMLLLLSYYSENR